VRDGHKESGAMAKQIICQCGFVGRGETAAEAAQVIEVHMQSDHPELVGEVSMEDLLAMAEEA
jgi:predicted small metal-binding protein